MLEIDQPGRADRTDQALDGSGCLTARIGPCEQIIFSPESERAKRSFGAWATRSAGYLHWRSLT